MPETYVDKTLAALNATYIAYLERLDASIITANCLPKCLSSLVAAYADDFFFEALRRVVAFYGADEGILFGCGVTSDLELDTRDLDQMCLGYTIEDNRNVRHLCVVSCNEVWAAIRTNSLEFVLNQKLTREMRTDIGVIPFRIATKSIADQIRWSARVINDEMHLGVVWPQY
jgi:hypothetical protein